MADVESSQEERRRKAKALTLGLTVAVLCLVIVALPIWNGLALLGIPLLFGVWYDYTRAPRHGTAPANMGWELKDVWAHGGMKTDTYRDPH
jgi:hypothetical protein